MRVALTFDDGPGPVTEDLAETLAQHGARATFFVSGCWLGTYGSFLDTVVACGHEVGNHAWTHRPLAGLRVDDAVAEVAKAALALEKLVPGHVSNLWRPPYHSTNAALDRVVLEDLGLRRVPAGVDPGDWLYAPEYVVPYTRKMWYDGAIVNLHDGTPPDGGSGLPNREGTLTAVKELLTTDGVEFVTVGEL